MNDWTVQEYLSNLFKGHKDVTCCNSNRGKSRQSKCFKSRHSTNGFKLFSDHIDWLENRNKGLDVYHFLERANVSVIILRRSALSTWVSGSHAHKSGVSHCGKGCDLSTLQKTVHIDVEGMLRHIRHQETDHRELDERLAKHRGLRVLRL